MAPDHTETQEMEIKEAYKLMQAQWVKDNDIKVGDTVRVVRKWRNYECGCIFRFFPDNFARIAKEDQVIKDISDAYVRIDIMNFPFFALEFISHAPVVEKMIVVKGKEYSKETLDKAIKQYVNG